MATYFRVRDAIYSGIRVRRKLAWLRHHVLLLTIVSSILLTSAVIESNGVKNEHLPGPLEGLQSNNLYSLVPLSSSTWVEWNRTYGGERTEYARYIQQTIDEGYIIAACSGSFASTDFWLIKTDAYGNVEWNRTYGGTELDGASCVQQTTDGGYIIAGETMSFGAGDGDFWLVKTGIYGDVEWNRTYGGLSWDRARSIQQTTDEGYVVVGHTASFGAGLDDFWLIKTDAYGNMEWNKTYGGGDSDQAYCVRQTIDGGYVMVGTADSFKTGGFDGEIWLVKTDEYGNVSWSWLSGWPDWDFAHSVQQTGDGGYIVAGTRFSSYNTRYDFWLVKIDANGTLEWARVFARPGGKEDVAYSVQQTADGGYIVAGGWGDFWLVKTDADGDLEWSRPFGGANSDNAYSVQQTSDGGYVVAGDTESFGYGRDGSPDVWVIKFFPSHDVAVESVELSKWVVGLNYSLSVDVTVRNPGFFPETFNITLYANTTAIGTQTVGSLSPEALATLTYTWNTVNFQKGNYTMSGYAWPVLNETKTEDNTLLGPWIFITLAGDVDGDREVDIFDIVAMASIYGTAEPNPKYDANRDIDNDGDVDIFDIVIAAGNYGRRW
jgi:hypothetical protein